MAAQNKKWGRLTGHVAQDSVEQRFVQEGFGKEEEARSEFFNKGPKPVDPSPIPQWNPEESKTARTRATPRSARTVMSTARSATSVNSRLTTIAELKNKKAAIEAELAALDKKIASRVKERKPKKAQRPFAAFPATHRDANVTTNTVYF